MIQKFAVLIFCALPFFSITPADQQVPQGSPSYETLRIQNGPAYAAFPHALLMAINIPPGAAFVDKLSSAQKLLHGLVARTDSAENFVKTFRLLAWAQRQVNVDRPNSGESYVLDIFSNNPREPSILTSPHFAFKGNSGTYLLKIALQRCVYVPVEMNRYTLPYTFPGQPSAKLLTQETLALLNQIIERLNLTPEEYASVTPGFNKEIDNQATMENDPLLLIKYKLQIASTDLRAQLQLNLNVLQKMLTSSLE